MTDQNNVGMNAQALLEKPEKPLNSDCCGNGCVPCILDIYDEEIKIWERECLQLQHGSNSSGSSYSYSDEDTDQEPLLCLSQYRKVRILSVLQETRDCFRFRLKLPKQKSLGLNMGQHIVIRGKLDSVPIARQYTPITHVSVKGYFDLLIKTYPGHKMSGVVKSWKEGDFIEIRGPFGNFDYKKNKYDVIYLVAAGTGIAPMSQVIQAILGDDEEETRITLIYACRTYEDILMKKELNEWAAFWNFKVLYALSKESPEASCRYRYDEEVHHGRVTRTLLDDNIASKSGNIKVLICGPKSFESDMIDHLTTLGLSEHQYFRF